MIRLGFSSGYAIRKAVEHSTRTFWPISLAQIYPELARLQRAGLLARRSDPRGAQARSAYAITERGEEAFLSWLRSTEIAPLQLRDEGFLRLYFADLLPLPGQLELLGHMRDNEREMTERMRAIASFQAPAGAGPLRYPGVVSRYGVGCYGFSVRWMTNLAAELEARAPKRPARPRPAASQRPPAVSRTAPIKLTSTSYLILAMVQTGASSGYAIKRAADESTQAVWPTSFAELYPQLGRMHAAGLLQRREDPRGGRERSAYTITEQGAAALRAWLRSARLAPTKLRYETLLRLFFADALDPAEQLALVSAYRQRSRFITEAIREHVIPRVDREYGNGFPAIVSHFALDKFAYSVNWLGRLQRQLEAGKLPPATRNGSS